MSGSIGDLLYGIHRYFPNIVILTLLVGGLAMGKIAWLMVALGCIVIVLSVVFIQYLLKIPFSGYSAIPGVAAIQACSLLPSGPGDSYSNLPSMWVTLTTFFAAYILRNAMNVYTTKPQNVSNETIQVQQRKGVGIISMLAVAILYLVLMVGRYMTGCESIGGLLVGIVIGAFMGYTVWWPILNACGASVYPDIHGVMIGLTPGALHNVPQACMVASN
jgi:hypothetical protein